MLEHLHELLADARYEAITEMAGRKKRVLSFLTALTYDQDALIGWRAVEATGLAAGRIAFENPEFVRNHLRRLLWMLNDESGGIGWRAPEAMGEIIRNQPERFSEFVPILISLLDMEEEDAARFRPGLLWAIGRLGPLMPERVETAIPRIASYLNDSNPQTRGMASWCLGRLGAAGHISRVGSLLDDDRPVDFYARRQIVRTSVARLAREALESGQLGN